MMTLAQFQKLNLFLIFFFSMGLLGYLLLNGGAFWANIRYDLLFNSPFVSEDLKRDNILSIATGTTATAAPSGTPAFVQLTEADVRSLNLIIPKIEVTTPVVRATENSNQGVLSALEQGVGLYPNSALPGENGRAIILGHSSRASWYRGEYAYIFSLLPRLDTFDEFQITANGKKLNYKVFARKILTKEEANALFKTPSNGSEVDLVTCYPIGSAAKRTVIQAKLVSVENI
jgi:LPXTG-site transpeptidase (sortase) family protein